MIYDKLKAEPEIKDSRRPSPTTPNIEPAESPEPADPKSRQCPRSDERVFSSDFSSYRRSPFLRSDHLIPIRTHSCSDCRKNFATSSGLKQHQHIHKSVKPFQCKVCLKAYTQFSNLCRHKRMHADCRQQIKCHGCGQAFSTLISLNKHKRFCDVDRGGIVHHIRHTASDQFVHPHHPPSINHSHRGTLAGDNTLPLTTLPQSGMGTWSMYRPQLPHQISSHLWFPAGPTSPLPSSSATATLPSMPIFQGSASGFVNAYETFQRLLDARVFSPSTYDRLRNVDESVDLSENDVRSSKLNRSVSPFKVSTEVRQERNYNRENIGGDRGNEVSQRRYESPDRSASNASSTSPKSSKSSFRAWSRTSLGPRSLDREPILRPETKDTSVRSSPCQMVANGSNREDSRPLDLTTSHKSFQRFDREETKQMEESVVKTPTTSFPSVESLESSAESQGSTKPVMYFGLPPGMHDRPSDHHRPSDRDRRLWRSLTDRYEEHSTSINPSRVTALLNERRFLDPFYPHLLSDTHYRFNHREHPPFIGQRGEPGHPSIGKHQDVFYRGNHHPSISSFSPVLVSPLASISDLLSFKPAKPRDRYTCRYCGKVFPRSANLTRHLRTHTGEQPYRCQYCRRCFSISSNLQRHVRNIHNKEKPFRCHLCERCFGQQTNLDRHVKKHEGAPPSAGADHPTGTFHPHRMDAVAFPRRDRYLQGHEGLLGNHSLPLTTLRPTDSWQVPGTGSSARVDSGVESTDGNSSPTRWREMEDWETDRKCLDEGRASVDSESESIDVVDTESSQSNVDDDVIGNDDISTCIYGSDHEEASEDDDADDDDDVIIDIIDCPVTP